MISKLSVIIINYYSEDLVLTCIGSIREYASGLEVEIVIVNNGSSTSKLECIKDKSIFIIKNQENKGFGYACNQGVKKATGEYLLFLNPDTKVYKGSLSKAILKLEREPNITVLGCKQIDEHNRIHRSCARYLSIGNYMNKTLRLNRLLPSIFKSFHMADWDHTTSRYVDHVIGAFYLIRKRDFLKVSGFDEDYFVYYEDLDLSKRITENGGTIFYDADIEIFHQGGGASQKVKAKRLFYSLDALLTYGKKHFTPISYIVLKLFVLFIEPIIRIIKSLISFQFSQVSETIKAYNLLFRKRFKL